jgi:hypothetical protein
LKLISIFSPLRCTPSFMLGRTPLRPGAQPAAKVRALALLRALHARAPLGSSRAPANIGRQSLSHINTVDTHTHMDGSHLPTTIQPTWSFHRLLSAPVPHHHFVVECVRVWCFDLLTLHWMLATPPTLSTSTHAKCAQPDVQPSAQPALQPDVTKVRGTPPFCFSGGWDKECGTPLLPSTHSLPRRCSGGVSWLAAHNTEAMQSCCHVLLGSLAAAHEKHASPHSIHRPYNSLLHHWYRVGEVC